MITEGIIIALITGAVTLIGNMLVSAQQNKKASIERAIKDQQIQDRLTAIEHKLDIHNGYAEKLGEIKQDIAVIKTEIQHLKE